MSGSKVTGVGSGVAAAARTGVKGRIVAALDALGADRAMRHVNRRCIVVLMYHGFTDRPSHAGIENHQGKHLHVDRLRWQVQLLKRHFTVVPLEQVVASYTGGAPLPDRAAVITVDDGYRSTYTLAYPVFRDAGVPATVFVPTAFVEEQEPLWTDRVEYTLDRAPRGRLPLRCGVETVTLDIEDHDSRIDADRALRARLKTTPQEQRSDVIEQLERAAGCRLDGSEAGGDLYRPLRWKEAIEMGESGLISIGSHTHTHAILTQCRLEDAEEELVVSRRIIETRLGRPCRLFSYPNGASGDFDERTERLLIRTGYTCGLTTVAGLNDRDSNILALKRLNISSRLDPAGFLRDVSGVSDVLSRLGRLVRRRRPEASKYAGE